MSDNKARVLVVGNPNAGKSTLFNALTGGGARVGNFAGTTVSQTTGSLSLDGRDVTLVDVPGTYSVAARSPEERVAINAVLGLGGNPQPDALLVVCDGPRLLRSLYLALQLLELEVPVVLAVNLMDEARTRGVLPDIAALSRVLGVPAVATVARSGEGLDDLRGALAGVLDNPGSAIPGCPHGWSERLANDADRIAAILPSDWGAADWTPGRRRAMALWVLLSLDEDATLVDLPDELTSLVAVIRAQSAADGRDIQTELVGTRYTWIDGQERVFVQRDDGPRGEFAEDRLDRVLLHPLWGSLAFFTVMGLVFTALFAWADPFIGAIEQMIGMVGDAAADGFVSLSSAMPGQAGAIGLVGDFVVHGLIGGIGAVVVFLPQIALLFLFIGLLEDCGYLARAAHLMDRVLRAAGLPGKAFVPLLSGYACAVPGIMATRTMPRFRDRLLTMMVLPLTSCSARLPVYTLMIAAVFPPTIAGLALPLRPLVLFALYLFSTGFTVAAAIILGRVLLPEESSPDVLELPPYRIPDPYTVLRMVASRCGDFLREAGGIILWATIVLWALLTFPQYSPDELLPADVIAQHTAQEIEVLAAPIALERSYAGQLGQAIEPTISPLGYDWKIGVGLIGAFAAREVFVATMGMVYGIEGEVDEESTALRDRIREARRSDGSRVYTPLTGMSLLVFFALAMQCLSTMAVLKKETQGWRWPAFIFGYMTALAWGAAFVVYQGGRLLGFT